VPPVGSRGSLGAKLRESEGKAPEAESFLLHNLSNYCISSEVLWSEVK